MNRDPSGPLRVEIDIGLWARRDIRHLRFVDQQ
jgi:hypothetical protein